MKIKTIAALLSCWVVLLCLPGCGRKPHAGRYKIALVHSYEAGYPDAGRTREMLSDALARHGISCDFREYFLDCDDLLSAGEEKRCSDFIDDFTRWGAHLVAVLDDQALYSLMACGNPRLHDLPVVFGGVNYPNRKLLERYPNVTGYADAPDYLNTVRMVERIMGKSRVCVINRNSVLDRFIWNDLTGQLRGKGYEIYCGQIGTHVSVHRGLSSALPPAASGMSRENERFDTTAIVRLNGDSLSLTQMAWTGHGHRTLCLFTRREFIAVHSANFFHNPCFETVNEGFGTSDYALGGYFAPLETQLDDMAQGIAERLRGATPDRQVRYCAKRYVVNWHVLQRYGIPLSRIPKEYTVMYIPFTERYRYTLLYIAALSGLLLLLFIAFLIRSLSVERRRKREAQHSLRYEHETLTLAISGSSTYVWRLEGEGIICDPHFYDLIRHPRERITLDEIIHFLHPDDRERFYRGYRASENVHTHKGHYRFDFTGGGYEWWELRYSTLPATASGGRHIITGLLQNIQDVKDHEEELIQARRLAERAELKQSFLNNMSHEIRTPLNAIAGFANLLVYDPELSETEKREYAGIIDTNTKLLLKLVDDVLQLSRMETANMSFDLSRESVRHLLEAVYRTHSVLIKPPLEFIADFPAEDAFVHADRMRLTQVVTNFLNNAGKFTSEGHIRLGYVRLPATREVSIYVEDTGIGIPQEEREMIFARFYKRSEFSQGVGLGLPICKVIVERLGGRIEVKSQVGRGSRFTVVLPCVE